MIYVIIALLVLPVLIFFYLILPGHAQKYKKADFKGRSIAHRGLYEADQSIPENSLSAFKRAVESGYGIELDVQLSSDGQVVVFHDDTLDRVCGVNRRVDGLTYAELHELSLYNTNERIPLFSDVLNAVSGKVPLIVELKTGKRNKELCQKTLALLSSYNGIYCIESFDPFIVKWFRFHASHILRGQLSQTPSEFVKANAPKPVAFILGNVLFNFLSRPHFIAHRTGKKTPAVRISEKAGAMDVIWTVRSKKEVQVCDVMIFEYFRPDIHFPEAKK